MTRPIKFRAWDTVAKCWHVFTLDELFEGQVRYPAELKYHSQFTGLLDKNGKGKEAYENDIFKSGNGRLWQIRHGEWKFWDGKQLCPMYGWYAWGIEKEGESHAELPLYPDALGEIIGNIYSNPELLK